MEDSGEGADPLRLPRRSCGSASWNAAVPSQDQKVEVSDSGAARTASLVPHSRDIVFPWDPIKNRCLICGA